MLLAGRLYARLNPNLDQISAGRDRPVETVPTAVAAEGAEVVEIQDRVTITDPGMLDSFWSPALSADGAWLAFSSPSDRLAPGDANGEADIFVYNIQSGDIRRASLRFDGQEPDRGSANPRISGDGSYLVFVSQAGNLTPNAPRSCPPEAAILQCAHIYFWEQATGSVELVSPPAFAGQQVNGASFGPEISSDGRWIAYWSTAAHPAAFDRFTAEQDLCDDGRVTYSCMDIYVYDRENSALDRIRVGRAISSYNAFLDDIRMSADGQYLVFRVDQRDAVAADLGVAHPSEAFVFDRFSGAYQPLNVAPDGAPGSGPSFSADISEDGSWVVFASAADNLVAGDTNETIDVFLKNRRTGQTERVNLGPEGQEAESASGVITGWDYWFANGLSISGDGRWVLYTSDSQNLVRHSIGRCNVEPFCQNLYLFDRLRGVQEQVNNVKLSPIPQATLSKDAGRIAFLSDTYTCFGSEICTNIFVSERIFGLTAALDLSNALISQSGAPWSYWKNLGGYAGWVTDVAFSPDGQLLAAGSTDGQVRLWSSQTGELEQVFEGHQRPVNSVEFSPDGALLAVGVIDTRVYVWRVAEGSLFTTLDGNPGAVRDLEFHPAGRWLAVAAANEVWIWDPINRTVEDRRTYPGGHVSDVAFAPDGRLLAIAAGDHTVWIQRLEEEQTLLRLGGRTEPINAVGFSPDGRLVAAAGQDNQLMIWRLSPEPGDGLAAEAIRILHHRDWVSDVDFSADDSFLAASSYDGILTVWEIQSDQIHLLPHPKPIRSNQIFSVAISPDQRLLAAGTVGGAIHLWRRPDPPNSSIPETGPEGLVAGSPICVAPGCQLRGQAIELPAMFWAEQPQGVFTDVWAEQDLNCDGTVERVLVTHDDRGMPASSEIVGLALESISEEGPIRIWSAHLGIGASRQFPDLELVSLAPCEVFLFAQQNMESGPFDALRLFSVQGELTRVNQENPVRLTIEPYRPEEVITAEYWAAVSGASRCFRTLTTHRLDGKRFRAVEHRIERAPCDF